MSGDRWGRLSLEPGAEVERSLGALRLRIRRRADEIWIHARHDRGRRRAAGSSLVGQAAGESSSGDVSAGDSRSGNVSAGDWIRWAVPADREVELRPALPDRPIVVVPEQPFFLPPAGRARVFVRVPLFVRIEMPDDRGRSQKLEEFPTLVLSDTWWGAFTEGEIAYWLGTQARREMSAVLFEPHLAVCPFVLINESDQALPVERFAVRVAYLTLFGDDRAVWTDEVQVRYQGPHAVSDIRYTGRIPVDAGDVEEMAKPREPAPRGFHGRTFGRLRVRVGAL